MNPHLTAKFLRVCKCSEPTIHCLIYIAGVVLEGILILQARKHVNVQKLGLTVFQDKARFFALIWRKKILKLNNIRLIFISLIVVV